MYLPEQDSVAREASGPHQSQATTGFGAGGPNSFWHQRKWRTFCRKARQPGTRTEPSCKPRRASRTRPTSLARDSRRVQPSSRNCGGQKKAARGQTCGGGKQNGLVRVLAAQTAQIKHWMGGETLRRPRLEESRHGALRVHFQCEEARASPSHRGDPQPAQLTRQCKFAPWRPFTLSELDTTAERCKPHKSTGIDGVSYGS